MNWHLTPYAIPMFVGSAIMLVIGGIAWRRRHSPGVIFFGLMCFLYIFYTLGYAFEIGSVTLSAVRFWLKIEYIGITFAPVMVFCMVLIYTGFEPQKIQQALPALLVIPLATLLLAWTNEYHELLWENMRLEKFHDIKVVDFTPGFWYWINVGYIWTLMLGSIILALRAFASAADLLRRQISLLLIGILGPMIFHIIYISGLNTTNIDLTPYGLIISAAVLAWGILRYEMLDIMPIAHQAILDSMRDAVLVIDQRQRIVELNPAAQRLFNPQCQPCVGSPAKEFLGAWPPVLRAIEDKKHPTAEITLTIQDQDYTFDLSQSMLSPHHATPSGRLIVLRDITHRIQTEKELKDANTRLQTLRSFDAELTRRLDVKYVARMALDAVLRVSLADNAFIALMQDDVLRIVHGHGNFPHEMVDTPLRLDNSITARVLQRRTAELVPDVRSDPLYLEIVPDTRAQISVPLISGRKVIGVITLETADPSRFSASVFEMITMLATRVAVAIDNAFMYQESEKLVKELDAFAHTVAHDLKNPLNNVSGYAEMMLMNYDAFSDEDRKEYLSIITRNVDKAIDIIHALLLLAGARTVHTVEIGPLDMGPIVTGLSQRLSRLIEQHNAELILPDSWPLAQGFAPWVEEIWANYVSNAIKYGGQPPRVELGYDPPHDGCIRFWVRDNGQGLDPEKQAKLFQPFSRLGQLNIGGHGLGLSIVQRIAERLNGSVGVESEPQKGSLFYFTLPAG